MTVDDEPAAGTARQACVHRVGDAAHAADSLGEGAQAGVVVDGDRRLEAFGEGHVDPFRSRAQHRPRRSGARPARPRGRAGDRHAGPDALKRP
ncbi:hypothetical protein [Streptomyces sp. NEAU-W12]|uniref:hypothetical protein n=1 Tax=Streptomyces sp. NEAU-W12 TaxID=2994668 RepID=UPI00224B565C|nr:hypothetical protein [Streptomyces sp. NEAU-W12]MCX2926149.1 hypothetical protein [Streptomyces sp. NEAU-W12]